MPEMRQRTCKYTGSHRGKNQAERLFPLGTVDSACPLHLRTDTYYSCHNQLQNQVKNSQRGGLSELRIQVEGELTAFSILLLCANQLKLSLML